MNNWDDLLYFHILVSQQTLTAAAETLGVQHSTVARRIVRLEATLGLRLFDRMGRRYLLTADGARIHEQTQDIAIRMNTLLRTAREQREAVAQVLISAPPLVVKGLLMPHFADFARRHPHIRLVLQSDAQISNLHNRQADIALRTVRPTQNDLIARRLRTIRYRFYAHANYAQNHPAPSWAYLHCISRSQHSHWAEAQLAHRRVILACNDFDAIKAAIAAQTGIGLLPDFYVYPHDNFVQVGLDGAAEKAEFASEMHWVMHEDLRHSPSIRTVADFLSEVLAD